MRGCRDRTFSNPFTAKDVQCTWDLLTGKASEKLRVNPRKSWYRNLAAVTTNGDYEVTFHLTRPQPAFLTLLASGYSPIYPCHVPPRDMRQHPIGTGPFKFVAFKPNEYIKVTRNPDYWKKGRPYLDGIEYTIIRNLSTAILAFVWPWDDPPSLVARRKRPRSCGGPTLAAELMRGGAREGVARGKGPIKQVQHGSFPTALSISHRYVLADEMPPLILLE